MKEIYTRSSWSILALLRFVLAMIVLIGHLKDYFISDADDFAFITNLGGRAAVIGFLLISGVSVGTSYVNNKENFFTRWFLRIYPLYFVAVVFTIILIYSIGEVYIPAYKMKSAGLMTNLANLFFLQGLITITITYNGPLWSLGIEVLYYTLAPIFNKIHLPYLILIVVISLAVFMFGYDYDFLYGYTALKYGFAWLIGFLFAIRKQASWTYGLLLVSMIVIFFHEINQTDIYSWLTVFVTSLVIFGIAYREVHINATLIRIFNYLGELSYPLYLFHRPILFLLYVLGMRDEWLLLFVAIILIVPINHIFDHWLKKIFWVPVTDWFLNNLKNARLNLIHKK